MRQSGVKVSTENVEMLVVELGLMFETAAQRKRWYEQPLRSGSEFWLPKGLLSDATTRRHTPPRWGAGAGSKMSWRRAPANGESDDEWRLAFG